MLTIRAMLCYGVIISVAVVLAAAIGRAAWKEWKAQRRKP
jgi:hypothetical protein